MNNDMVEITGLTPVSEYPCCNDKDCCKEFCETDKLCLPCQKPNIKDIIEVCVCITITSFKVICTPQGKKIIIDGLKHIKLIYNSEKSCHSVHCAHFDIPFCEFILLNSSYEKVVCIETAIEHICVHQISCRDFSVSTVILLCPVLKKHCDFVKSRERCDECNSYEKFSTHDKCNWEDDDCNCQEHHSHNMNCRKESNDPHCNTHSKCSQCNKYNHEKDSMDNNFNFNSPKSSFYYCDEAHSTYYKNKY